MRVTQACRKHTEKGWEVEWADIINDLEDLKETIIETGNKEVILRSELKGEAGKAFQAAGVAVPKRVKITVKNEKKKV